MQDDLEYRVPAKLLGDRDPIILNKLSLREFFQWLFFFGLIYISFNLLPFDFVVKLVVAVVVGMFGLLFIHSPINGLAGIEWAYVHFRYQSEKGKHQTVPPPQAALGVKPIFRIVMANQSYEFVSPFSEVQGEISANNPTIEQGEIELETLESEEERAQK